MKKRYRRIYAFTLVILFFIVAPLLLLYATGYRYNFGENKVVKTGVLSVDSTPRNAEIKVNGELISSSTPTVVKNLLPGEYTVSIEKDGYFSWEKTLPVFPNRSTSSERVSLLKSDGPTLVTQEKASSIAFSPKEAYLAYTTTNQDGILSLTVKQQSTLRTIFSKEEIEDNSVLEFSNNENYILLRDNNTNSISRIISLAGNYDVYTNSISELPILDFVEQDSEDFVYLVTKNTLLGLNINSNSAKDLLENPVMDIIEVNGSSYFIQELNEKVVLYKSNLEDLSNPIELIDLPPNGKYSLSNGHDNYLIVHESTRNRLKLINIQNEQSLNLYDINQTVTNFIWSPSYEYLLIYNDFELWIHDLEKNQQELLLRSSTKVKDAEWSPDGKWIIYSHEGFIKAIELDGIDKRNIINLAQTDIIPFTVNKDKKIMFYHDSSQNLFQKEIQ